MRKKSLLVIVVVLLTLFCGRMVLAANEVAVTPATDWTAIVVGLVGLIFTILAKYSQSPLVGKVSAWFAKLLPDWTTADIYKAERILTSDKGKRDFRAWVQSYPLTLLVCILALAAFSPAAQAQGTSLLTDTGSFTVAYAHAFKGDADGLIGKLSVDFWDKQIGNRTITAALDLNAVPDDGKTRFGLGASATLGNGVIGLGLGVAYIPGDNWGLTWTVTAVQFKF